MKNYFSTFVGIPLPETIRNEYNQLLDEIKPISRLFDLANRYTPHITLSFMGEKSEKEISESDRIIQNNLEILSGIKINIARLGQFSPENPRIVFLEIKVDPLEKAHQLLNDKLDVIEAKEFHPHLTLFRLRSEEAQSDFIQNLSQIENLVEKIEWDFPIEEVAIYGVDQDRPKEGQKILYGYKI